MKMCSPSRKGTSGGTIYDIHSKNVLFGSFFIVLNVLRDLCITHQYLRKIGDGFAVLLMLK